MQLSRYTFLLPSEIAYCDFWSRVMAFDKEDAGALGRILVRFFSSPLFTSRALDVYRGRVDSKHKPIVRQHR